LTGYTLYSLWLTGKKNGEGRMKCTKGEDTIGGGKEGGLKYEGR